MSQKPLSGSNAEATGGKESTFEPSQSSTARTALPTIQENASAHEEALQTGASVTALSTTLEESREEQPSQEAAVSTHSTEGQATKSNVNTTRFSAEGQLEEVYQQQGDAAALIDQSLTVELPSSSHDYDQLPTAPNPAVEPQPITPESASSSDPEAGNMAAQSTLKVVIPRRGNKLLPFVREISFEQGRMTVDRRDEFNRPWRIPQRRQNEESRQLQVSRPPGDGPQLQPGEFIRYQPATMGSGPMDHTPMITGPRSSSLGEPAQSAQPAPNTNNTQYIIVVPNASAFAASRAIITPRNPYFTAPHLTTPPAPSTERRIFPRWNQTTAPPHAAPIASRPAQTSSTLFDARQPTGFVAGSASSSTTSTAPTVPADPEEAIRMGWPVVRLGDICPCNLDGHHCMLPVRCRFLKNKICTKKDCKCNNGKPESEHKHHTKATCNSIREGRPCEFGGYGFCWFGHDAPGETARVDQARIHRAHHQGDI